MENDLGFQSNIGMQFFRLVSIAPGPHVGTQNFASLHGSSIPHGQNNVHVV